MAFDLVIFVAALWALSTEMAEDSVVDMIYGHLFGWRTFVKALVIASVIVASASIVVVFLASSYLQAFLGPIQKGAAVLLAIIGLSWLATSLFGKEDEIEEVRSRKGNLSVALQLVSIEELEIVLIIVPLVLSSRALEAAIAASIGVLLSVSFAAILRGPFSRFVEGRLRQLKVASGTFLILLGLVLFLD